MAARIASDPWRRIRTQKGLVPRAAIRRAVEQIVREFEPDQVYLFGSYAYGEPDKDSDVDILVVMSTRNEIDQSVKIHLAVDPAFAFDVIVRKPRDMRRRLREGDWFLREIVSKGILCHESSNATVARESGKRYDDRTALAER